MTESATATTIKLREPYASELQLCRMLLPDACNSPVARYFRLAFAGELPKPVGALSYRDDAIVLGGVRVHVIPTRRRNGIGTQLLDYAANEARRLQRPKMLADADLKSEPEAEPFLTSRGFRKLGTITFAEIDLPALRERMKLAGPRLEAGATNLPSGVRLVSLKEAPMEDVTRLYAEYIAHMQPLTGLRDAFRLDSASESVALLMGERLVGFVLARVDAGTLHIPAWVVIPEARGQQVGNALLNELAKRVRGRVERMRFEFTEAALVTPRVLNLPEYKITKIAARFECDIPHRSSSD